ncbi:MAG: imidazole glycerol phosphate synthase subunit HisH [Pseudomonadota bacterium]
MATALIIDYGMGNLHSVRRAFEECGAEVLISDDPKAIRKATHIVLPGVGAFHDGMTSLVQSGWCEAVRRESKKEGIPVLGICLGMQLLAEAGDEGGEIKGLGLVPGRIEKMKPDSSRTRIPHVGWNEIYRTRENPLFEGIPDGTDFYFVHSYRFVPETQEIAIAMTPYCGEFASAVMHNNVFGVQFHPEKSQKYGFQVIKNFLARN